MTKKIVLLVVGLVVVILIIFAVKQPMHPSSTFVVTPSSGTEDTAVTITYPATATPPPAGVSVKFFDAGAHGWLAVQKGAGEYVSYDPATNLSYVTKATAAKAADATHVSYTATVPAGICGLIIQSAQAPAAPPKSLAVSLVDANGKAVAGTGSFSLTCDKYTLNVKMVSSKDPVLPNGADQATITATLSVTGPAQFINGVRVKPTASKIMLTTPLGLVMTHFSTDLGALAPNPSNVKTDLAGNAVVTITSPDAGIATVRVQATGIGDSELKVHFPPKIVGVKEDFVQPTSPTNFVISTIPANGKDLTYAWTFMPAPGISCGHLTGAASGLGESTNGFYHGPSDAYKDGCPEVWEFASKMQVVVTDKDGQSDTKIFPLRSFEGQGVVKL